MKHPKDMTREELADDIGMIADPYIQEAAARLRNSMDKPTIEVEHDAGLKVWSVRLNEQIIYGASYIASEHGDLYARNYAEGIADNIRLALGMEGGA